MFTILIKKTSVKDSRNSWVFFLLNSLVLESQQKKHKTKIVLFITTIFMKKLLFFSLMLSTLILTTACNKQTTQENNNHTIIDQKEIPYSWELIVAGLWPIESSEPTVSEKTLVLKKTFQDHSDHVFIDRQSWSNYLDIQEDIIPWNKVMFVGKVQALDSAAWNHYYQVSSIKVLEKIITLNKENIQIKDNDKLTWTIAKPIEVKNNFTTKTTPHKEAPGEDIFVYNNWQEILSIVSTNRATYLYELINNIMIVDEWTNAWNRNIIVYNLNTKNIILDDIYYGSFETNKDTNTIIYPKMNYDKPENSKVECWEQEWYFQKHKFNYQKLENTKIWEVYCSYVE